MAESAATDYWDALTRAHRDDLVRTARARLHDGRDAEDVVHEVLLRMIRHRLRPDTPWPLGYLRRAVANECVSHWRRRHREIIVDEFPELPSNDWAEPFLDQITVRQALTTLTERQRVIVTLTYFYGCSDLEIAERLDIQPVTVRTIRRRALARLRRSLPSSTRKVSAPPARASTERTDILPPVSEKDDVLTASAAA